MTVGRRPKRSNPDAERLTFICELERCPKCGARLSSVGSTAHSDKTVQTLSGEFYVVAYSRICRTTECEEYGTHFHAGGHLQVSPPYSTYGLDVIAFVGIQHEREHKQFTEIAGLDVSHRALEIAGERLHRLHRQGGRGARLRRTPHRRAGCRPEGPDALHWAPAPVAGHGQQRGVSFPRRGSFRSAASQCAARPGVVRTEHRRRVRGARSAGRE